MHTFLFAVAGYDRVRPVVSGLASNNHHSCPGYDPSLVGCCVVTAVTAARVTAGNDA